MHSAVDYTLRPKIVQFDPVEWPFQAAKLIQDTIQKILVNQGNCSVMLTGGRVAERLFSVWAEFPAFQQLRGVQFYFGDERCVPPDSVESNYGMSRRVLFRGIVPAGCSVVRMEADDFDSDAAADRYAEALPKIVDVMLMGVGEDGHIASLFPGTKVLQSLRRVVPVIGPKPPARRMTITPRVIKHARFVYVLAAGCAKAAVLTRALAAPSDVSALPVRLLLNATWLVDSSVPDPNSLQES